MGLDWRGNVICDSPYKFFYICLFGEMKGSENAGDIDSCSVRVCEDREDADELAPSPQINVKNKRLTHCVKITL